MMHKLSHAKSSRRRLLPPTVTEQWSLKESATAVLEHTSSSFHAQNASLSLEQAATGLSSSGELSRRGRQLPRPVAAADNSFSGRQSR